MTDLHGNLICVVCGAKIEGDFISVDLCNLCYKQMGEDLQELDTLDSQADGHK